MSLPSINEPYTSTVTVSIYMTMNTGHVRFSLTFVAKAYSLFYLILQFKHSKCIQYEEIHQLCGIKFEYTENEIHNL